MDYALKGKRITIHNMPEDPNPVEPGTQGTILGKDDMGQIMVQWDNGRTLSALPGIDSYTIESEPHKILNVMKTYIIIGILVSIYMSWFYLIKLKRPVECRHVFLAIIGPFLWPLQISKHLVDLFIIWSKRNAVEKYLVNIANDFQLEVRHPEYCGFLNTQRASIKLV